MDNHFETNRGYNFFFWIFSFKYYVTLRFAVQRQVLNLKARVNSATGGGICEGKSSSYSYIGPARFPCCKSPSAVDHKSKHQVFLLNNLKTTQHMGKGINSNTRKKTQDNSWGNKIHQLAIYIVPCLTRKVTKIGRHSILYVLPCAEAWIYIVSLSTDDIYIYLIVVLQKYSHIFG